MDEQTGEEIIEDSSENGEICIKQKTESDFISNLLQNVHNASFVLLRMQLSVGGIVGGVLCMSNQNRHY